jgi:hypothetical protein
LEEEEPMSVFNIFHSSCDFKINVERYKLLHRKGMETATFLPIAAGQFYLLSYWMLAVICSFPSSFPIPSKNFP